MDATPKKKEATPASSNEHVEDVVTPSSATEAQVAAASSADEGGSADATEDKSSSLDIDISTQADDCTCLSSTAEQSEDGDTTCAAEDSDGEGVTDFEADNEEDGELESGRDNREIVPRICSYTRSLDVSGARLIRLPVDIIEYTAVVQLRLDKNLLTAIQPELLSLHRLEVLSLASNSLSSMPADLASAWPHLLQLDLSKNNFEDFPESVTKLSTLVSLKLSRNTIKCLPESIAALETLASLDLRGNRLESLPSAICNLKSLKRIALQANQLQSLPPGMEGMGLESIGVQGNPGDAAIREKLSSCKGLEIDSKASHESEGAFKLSKSWSSKIGLKPRDALPSRKTSKQKSAKTTKRKSQTHDDMGSPLGLYGARRPHKERSGERKEKVADKRTGEEKKKRERVKREKQGVERVHNKQEVDLLPGKFQNGINFALTGSELRVRGASIDRLVALLTYDCGIDLSEYQRSFITMYPEFMADIELLKALIKRYNSGGDVARERVMKLLNLWITTHKTRFFQEDGKELHEQLVAFCRSVGGKGDSLVALLGRLEKRMKKESKGSGWHEPEVNKSSFQRSVSSGDAKGHDVPSWKDLKPRKLAEQLCLISHAQFKHIEVHEWLNKAWSKENGHELAPNLVAFINWTNRESAVLSGYVLSQKNASARGHAISQLLSTAEKCVELNNFSSAWSIFSALNGAAINQQRLKQSWEGVSMKNIRILNDLETLFNMSNNFVNFRTQLKKVKPPCIPSVMLVTKDLIFMDEGNPKALEDGSINFEMYNMKAQTILQVRDLQRLGYDDFVPNESLQAEFFGAMVMTHQEMYAKSLVLEPKAAAAPSDGRSRTEKGEGRGKGGTLKAAKKRQTLRGLAKQLFSDQDLIKTMEEAKERSPRGRSKTLATPKDQLAALEREGVIIPACGDKFSASAMSSSDTFSASPPPIGASKDDSSLLSSRVSVTKKKSMEAENCSALSSVRDDSGLEKTEADRQFAALLSPRALAPSSPKLDPAKRATVKTNVQTVDLFNKRVVDPSNAPTPVKKTFVKRQAGSGAPGTGLARRPLNFLAPPLPVGESLSDGENPDDEEDLPQELPAAELIDSEEPREAEDADDSDPPGLECLPRPEDITSTDGAESADGRPDDGEAILEELSDMLDPAPPLPPTPREAPSIKTKKSKSSNNPLLVPVKEDQPSDA